MRSVHSPGQLADGLHLLGLPQLRLQLARLGNVAKSPDSAAAVPCLVAHRRGVAVHDGPIDKLNFIPADLLRMGMVIGDLAPVMTPRNPARATAAI
jgi:hypothetical protein